MKKWVTEFFNVWYNPIILSIAVGLICFYFLTNPFNEYVFSILLLLPLLLLIISGVNAVIKIFKKNFKHGLLQLFTTLILFVAGLAMASFTLVYFPYDFYADSLKIPKNITIEKPIDLDVFDHNKSPSSIVKKHSNTLDFQLYNSSQPGIYTYDVWTNTNEKGFYYLKAIEITKNDTLSDRSISRRSKIENQKDDKNIKRLELKDVFTIYEGDWGKPYSAKFELWFHDDSLKTDRKLVSKNYIIEGWMR